MGNLIQKGEHLLRYCREFGFEGFRFIHQQKLGKRDLLQIRPPGIAHPIALRRNTTDIPMFDCIFRGRELDVHLTEQPSVIVDCGAHIGLSAVLYANKFPGAQIYAIEPERSNYELLVKNTAPYANITCLNKGIWNTDTRLRIVDAGLGHWGFMTEETESSGPDTIDAISIEGIMRRYGLDHIDLLKINIEGTEKEVFESNHDYWLPRTGTIIIELHDRMRRGCSRALFQALMAYEFSIDPKGSYLTCTLGKKAEPDPIPARGNL